MAKLETLELGNVTLLEGGDGDHVSTVANPMAMGAVVGVIGICLFCIYSGIYALCAAILHSRLVRGTVPIGIPLSVFAILDILSLLGVAVNNAIVLVDFINTERESGITVDDAL